MCIGRHTVQRVDSSSSLWRRRQRTPLADLHYYCHGRVGIDTAFHDHDAHGSVTRPEVLESEGNARSAEGAHVAEDEAGLRAFNAYSFDGEIYYVSDQPGSGRTPLNRYVNAAATDHADGITPPDGYSLEETLGYPWTQASLPGLGLITTLRPFCLSAAT